jgi:hypothetical protein
MTAEERLARVETLVAEQKEDIRLLTEKVDRLLEAAHMGKGAWWLILRLGVVIAALVGAAAWLFDRMPHK